MLALLVPIVVRSAIGLLLGWIAALAVKAAARTLGCLVVVLFVLIQVLAYYGIGQWNWAASLQQLRPWAGVAEHAVESGLTALTYNLPLSLGFLLGLVLGMRR